MNIVLSAVLAAQLVLAGVLIWGFDSQATAGAPGPLLALDGATIDTIVVTDGDGRKLQLAKEDGRWRVPARDGFPTSQQKVRDLLDHLRNLQPRLPVTTSAAAHKRFKVTEDKFARRIELKNDNDTIATLYMGGSAGPFEVYARKEGDNNTYSIHFKIWNATTKVTDWLASKYLHRDESKLVQINLPGFTLERDGNAWRLAELGDDERTAVDKAGQLVHRLTTVGFRDVVGRKQDVTLPESTFFSYTLVSRNGDRITYRIRMDKTRPDGDTSGSSDAGEPQWLLTTSDSDYVFRIARFQISQVRSSERSELVLAGEADESKPAAGTAHSKAGESDASATPVAVSASATQPPAPASSSPPVTADLAE